MLHLWQSVAEGGKLVPSPVTAMSSCELVSLAEVTEAGFAAGVALTSEFFFARVS